MKTEKISPGRIVINIVVYGVGACFLAPFLISLLLSFKTQEETAVNLLAFPLSPYFGNFAEAMRRAKIFQSFRNSILTTFFSVLLSTLCSAMAGYGIGRYYHKRYMRIYELILLASLMLPFQTIMIPVYKMYKSLNLTNTIHGVVFMISGTGLAFTTMLYIGFIKTLPRELEEAAYIDGYGRIRIFFYIVFPLLKPITFTAAALNTLWTWNEFNISLIVLQKDAVKTIPMQQYVFFSQYNSNYNMAFAAAVISMIPIVIFFIIAQKYIIKGLTEGAVKG
jgi:raffinose/stachyose/melibiose transport system permease protein